jgi:thioredoxin-related protein
MKKYFIIISILITCSNIFAQEKIKTTVPAEPVTTVKWYSIEEAEKLNRVKPKKFIIDIYTDWCGWCKKMDNGTFTHPVIVKLLNDYFYAVKFNAETSDTIVFGGNKYINLNTGYRSSHPLAISLLGWRMSYPSFVYFTEKLEYLGPIPGYKTPEQMEAILTFIGQDKFRTTTLEEYEKTFKGQIKQETPAAGPQQK